VSLPHHPVAIGRIVLATDFDFMGGIASGNRPSSCLRQLLGKCRRGEIRLGGVDHHERLAEDGAIQNLGGWQIAAIVGRSPDAAKLLASRARHRVRGDRHGSRADLALQRRRVVFGFTIRRGRIVAIDLLADPERLRRLDLAVLSR
jgi:hypothetical protein